MPLEGIRCHGNKWFLAEPLQRPFLDLSLVSEHIRLHPAQKAPQDAKTRAPLKNYKPCSLTVTTTKVIQLELVPYFTVCTQQPSEGNIFIISLL